MQRYAVRLDSRSALKLPEPFDVEYGPVRVRATNWTDEKSVGGHQGLGWSVFLEATNAMQAMSLAVPVATEVADFLALTHGTAIQHPRPLQAFERGAEGSLHWMAQAFYGFSLFPEARRVFVRDEFKRVFQEIDQLSQTDVKAARRVKRAIHLLRRSSVDPDPIDRFEDLADALQSIETVLRKKFVPSTKIRSVCTKCGNALDCAKCGQEIWLSNGFAGVQHVIQKVLGRQPDDGKLINDTRNDIVHARKELGEIIRDLPRVTEVAEAALVAGIFSVLGYDPERVRAATGSSLRLYDTTEAQITVQAVLTDFREGLIEPAGALPSLRLVKTELLTMDGRDPQSDPDAVRGVNLYVTLDGYVGEWDLHSAKAVAGRDPRQAQTELYTKLIKVPRGHPTLDRRG